MRIVYLILSYLSAFLYGVYAYSYHCGIKKATLLEWIFTGICGIYFYYLSKQKK